MNAQTPLDAAPAADSRVDVNDGPPRPRRQALAAAITLLVLLAAAATWFAYSALTRPLVVTPDRAELVALDAQLTRIQDAIKPIAAALTSQTETSAIEPIDVAAYHARVSALRDLVDATNDLSATSPDALEVRDLILTGGSQVAAGMDEALTALTSDEASTSESAALRVDEGIANLQAARDKLDLLLGRLQHA
jgi:hypothetical protein